MRLVRALLLAALIAPAAAPATAETLLVTLSTDKIGISSNFTGGDIVVFGAVQRDEGAGEGLERRYDIVVTVRGPRGATTVREKRALGPMWVNRAARKFIATPAYAAVLSNRPIPYIAPDAELRQRYALGLEYQAPPPSDPSRMWEPEEVQFRSALVRLREKQKLFLEEPDGVKFLSPTVFRATARIPGGAPLGLYGVDVALFSGGVPIARTLTPFAVQKSGSEAFIANEARRRPLQYGLATVAIALFFGWLASVIFRRD
ncbi:MAG: TIGR02186 family protein [Hyphomicrobiales bacterium]|nr:TIGR02186 family protein [Hyphomicrobiales bacterium]